MGHLKIFVAFLEKSFSLCLGGSQIFKGQAESDGHHDSHSRGHSSHGVHDIFHD